MTESTFDFSTLFETYKTAMAPVYRAQQEGLKTLGSRPTTSSRLPAIIWNGA